MRAASPALVRRRLGPTEAREHPEPAHGRMPALGNRKKVPAASRGRGQVDLSVTAAG
jgi:hypothetical protein